MKRIVLTGSTGLIGTEFVQLFSLPRNAHLRIIARSQPPYPIPAEAEVCIVHDFHDVSSMRKAMEGADEMICCLGTTIRNAGSKQAFESTDVGIVTILTQLAHELGYHGFHLVSSIDADLHSKNFYLQCKGKAEQAVLTQHFAKTTIVRPSMLLGNRKEFRLGERIGIILMSILPFLFFGPLKRYRSIHSATVAKCLLYRAMSDYNDERILESEEIKEFVKLKINF